MNPISVDGQYLENKDLSETRQNPVFLSRIPHNEYIETIVAFAQQLMEQANMEEALFMYKNAIEWLQETEGSDSINLVPLLEEMAGIYRKKREFSKAANLYLRIFSIAAKALGSNHPKIADILEDYSLLLLEANQEIESAILITRAKTIRLLKPAQLPVRSSEEDLFSSDELAPGYEEWQQVAVS